MATTMNVCVTMPPKRTDEHAKARPQSLLRLATAQQFRRNRPDKRAYQKPEGRQQEKAQ